MLPGVPGSECVVNALFPGGDVSHKGHLLGFQLALLLLVRASVLVYDHLQGRVV